MFDDNRTYVELKFGKPSLTRQTRFYDNRTYVELKCVNITALRVTIVYDNRTYVELKCVLPSINEIQTSMIIVLM